jgi:geranylgeranyl pyrophosphate synthase
MSIGRAGIRVLSLLERDLQQVRTMLRESWADPPGPLPLLIRSGALDGGKLLRPSLLLLSGRLFGAVTADHIRAAAILELVHSASLLHDDVLDQSVLRRGVPTLNRRWGNRAAVLLGDLILAKAFELTASLEPDIRAILARTIRRTCDGEIQQAALAGDFQITERQYLRILSQKTAALFKGACGLGARLAGARPNECRLVARFGYNAGMAYQIMDDLLDITGDCRTLRKTLGTDVQNAKATLPLIHALDVLGESDRRSLLRRVSTRSLEASELSRIVAETGSAEYVLVRVNVYADRAIAAMERIPHTRVKAALLALIRNYCRAARCVTVEWTVAGQL